jgi:hypothetical protein
MLTRLNLNSRQEVNQAAEYRSGGRTTRKIMSGFNGRLGMPGTKLRRRPATTRTMGYGVWCLKLTRESGEDHDEKKEQEENDFDCVDAAALHHTRFQAFKITTKT